MYASPASHTQMSPSPTAKVAAHHDTFRLSFVAHPSGGLAFIGPGSEREGPYFVEPRAKGYDWSRVLYEPNGVSQEAKVDTASASAIRHLVPRPSLTQRSGNPH